MVQVILDTVTGAKIFIVELLVQGVSFIEASHLASLIGYHQPHSIRRQVLGDWKESFEEDKDYVLVDDQDKLAAYEKAFEANLGFPPARSRGTRLFLRGPGVQKVFARTTKPCLSLEEALAPLFGLSSEAPAGAAAKMRKKGAGSDQLDAHERQRQYEVLEALLDHLKHIKEPGLRQLAWMSAELGLGRRLDDVRELLGDARPVPTPPAPVCVSDYISSEPLVVGRDVFEPVVGLFRNQLFRAPPVEGPLFDLEDALFYGFKQIGEKAGGYSAAQAGKAADLVAARMGYTHEDIRSRSLGFNTLFEAPDSTGKMRKRYSFAGFFANLVLHELRGNPQFVPPSPKELEPFSGSGHNFPNLSRGPLE